jgi:hypothetical protein
MTLADDFTTFTDGLLPAEQATLGASLLLAVSAICLADDHLSLFELIATSQGTAAGLELLGPGFGELIERGKIGLDQAHLDLKRQCRDDLARLVSGSPAERQAIVDRYGSALTLTAPHVASGQALIARMPPAIRVPFEDFLARWLLAVAEASGGFLWWGERVSAEERAAARTLVSTLGITIRDPEIRRKFAIDR